MIQDTVKLRLWQISSTEKAYYFSTMPKDRRCPACPAGAVFDHATDWGRSLWIPKSIIEHISREPVLAAGEWPACMVTLPDWFVEKEGL